LRDAADVLQGLMIAVDEDPATGIVRIVLTPNASMTPRQSRLLIAGIGFAMAVIALFFAGMGAWLVLPFSGGEWLLLALAVWLVQKRATIIEVITIQERLVRVHVRRAGSECTQEFDKAWLRLERRDPGVRGHPSRLFLRRHRNAVEIGKFLIESERDALAYELRRLLLNQ
jgi:uncharacterized membrane protein